MKIIYSPKQSGKTTQLIKMSADSGAYIICKSHQEAYRIAQQAKDMNLSIPFPLTFDEFIRGSYYPPRIKGFLFDNLDEFLRHMTQVPVIAATLTDYAWSNQR